MNYPLETGIYEINGRRYRKTPFTSAEPTTTTVATGTKKKFRDVPDVYADEPQCIVAREDLTQPPQICAIDARILVHAGGKKWTASVHVPAAVMGMLLGQNRRSLKSLEDETGCKVKTPRKEKHEPCEISSIQSLESVQRCLDRIDIFLADAKKKMRVTHFIAIPCDHTEIQQNFGFFRDAILSGDQFDASCKKETLFTPSTRLHLTLTMVTIFDEAEDLANIRKIFEDLEKDISQILSSNPLIIDIQGIDIMNDDPSQVNVLYAKISGENVQKIANLVRDQICSANLAHLRNEQQDEDVKLHLTLMNSRYVAQAENRKIGTAFDARAILEEMGEMYFGTVKVEEICLCPLMSKTPKTQFYTKMDTLKIV